MSTVAVQHSIASTEPTSSEIAPDAVPNRFLTVSDWNDERYAALRELFNVIYRDELKGVPHPTHAKYPEKIVTHWSREWEYPYAAINAEVEPGMKVVDLGAGGSPLLPYLSRRRGCDCWAVDLNFFNKGKHNLRGFPGKAEEFYPEIAWHLESMDKTTLRDASMDRVFCISVLEHVGEAVAGSTFREIARILKPGGRAVITTDVFGEHRTLDIDFRRLIELAAEAGLRIRGACDWTVPPAETRLGTYDVVGMVFEHAR